MGVTAENLARKSAIPRERQQELAVESHARAAAAQQAGKLAAEIVPIGEGDARVTSDGCIRPGTTQAILAELKPAFAADGTVTAGTSSPLTDGAAATLVTSEDYARAHGLKPLARIRPVAVTGAPPQTARIGPVRPR